MIDRVKFTKEFPSLDGNIWIGMEGSVDPGQTPEQVLYEIETKIHDRMNSFGEGTYIRYETGKHPKIEFEHKKGDDDEKVEIEFEALKLKLFNTETYVEAADLLHKSPFKFVPELRNILNSKIGK